MQLSSNECPAAGGLERDDSGAIACSVVLVGVTLLFPSTLLIDGVMGMRIGIFLSVTRLILFFFSHSKVPSFSIEVIWAGLSWRRQ